MNKTNFKGAAAKNINNYFDVFHNKNIESINEVNDQFKIRYEKTLKNFHSLVDGASNAKINTEVINDNLDTLSKYNSNLFTNVLNINVEIHKLHGITTAKTIDNRVDQKFNSINKFVTQFLEDFEDFIANNRSEVDYMMGEIQAIKGLTSLVSEKGVSARMGTKIVSDLISKDEKVRKSFDEERGLNKAIKLSEDTNKVLELDGMGILKDKTESDHFLMVYGEKYLKDLIKAGREYVGIVYLGDGSFKKGKELFLKEKQNLSMEEKQKLSRYKRIINSNHLNIKWKDISKSYNFFGMNIRLPMLSPRQFVKAVGNAALKGKFTSFKAFTDRDEMLKYKFYESEYTSKKIHRIAKKNPELAKELKSKMNMKNIQQKLKIMKEAVVEELKFPKYINTKNLKHLFNIDQDFKFKDIKNKMSKLSFSKDNFKQFLKNNAKSYKKNISDLNKNISKTAKKDWNKVVREYKDMNRLGKFSKVLKYGGKILKPIGALMVIQDNASIKDTQKRLISTGVDFAALSGSAAAGAAAGAFVGGPIGIVVGIGAGILVDSLMNFKVGGKSIKNQLKDGINHSINKGKETLNNISKGFQGFGKKLGGLFGG